jgi:DUF2924 family protein
MTRRTLAPDRAALVAEIAGLSKAGIANLRERWKNLYGKQPPGGLGRSFLIRAIAYRLQEQACGGLKPSTRRLLARLKAVARAHRWFEKLEVTRHDSTCALSPVPVGRAHRRYTARFLRSSAENASNLRLSGGAK